MIQLGKNEFKFSDERYPNLIFLRHSKAAKTKINESGTKRLLKELDSVISDFKKRCPEGAIRLQKYIWGKGDVLKYPLQVKKNGVKVILDKYILGLPTSRVDSGKGEKLTLKTIPSFDRYIKLMDNLEGKNTDIDSYIDKVNLELSKEVQENILKIDLEKYEPYYKNIDYLALDYQMSQRFRSHLSELKRQVGFRKTYCDHTFIFTVDKLHCNYKCVKCRILISQDLGGNFISPLKNEKSLLKLSQGLEEMIESMDYAHTEWKQIAIMYQKYLEEKERLDLKKSVRELDEALLTLSSYMKEEQMENRYSYLSLKDFEFEILENEKWYLSISFASLEKHYNANQGFVEFIWHWSENMDDLARELEMELKTVRRSIEEIEESCSIAYSISVGDIPMFGREVKTVLAAVEKLDGKFGKTRISELLYGSESKEAEKHKLNEHEDYGKLKHLGKTFISTGIAQLVSESLIEIEPSRISKRLSLTPKGERLLRILGKDINDETINSLSFGDFVKLCLQGKVREKERKEYIRFKIMRDDIVFYKVLVQYLKTNENSIEIFEADLLSCTTERYIPILEFYEKWEEESGFKEMIKRIKGERMRNVN
ncbi:RQC domain-containing protein [Bacillus toyonensis]|uniref:RQC domain-containing protein n=1 Tax=Bacillus toyonensis TaxID=155322 RepID=UPI002E238A99|nr:RQC domain-containing protein [Bacillus toyonensis]MED2737027.1 RQC domain-containing protein [Bacillus toyonensis]